MSYARPRALLYTFLSKMFICFLSLFVSIQVSDAYVKVLSIIMFFSLNFSFFDIVLFYMYTHTQHMLVPRMSGGSSSSRKSSSSSADV